MISEKNVSITVKLYHVAVVYILKLSFFFFFYDHLTYSVTILMLAIMVVPLSTFSKWYFASTALHSKVAEQHHLQDWESLCRQWFQKTRGKTFHVFDVRVSTLFRAIDFNVRGSEGVAAANVHPTLKFGILNQRPLFLFRHSQRQTAA